MTDELVFETYIKATPERVWEAITTTEFRRQYFFGSTIEGDLRVGGHVLSHSPTGQLWGDYEIFVCDPPHTLSHGWRSLYDDELAAEPESRVTWTIEPQDGDYVKLTVVHDRLGGSPKTAEKIRGWTFVLSGLKSVLETGSGLR
ncbi:SRPBCC domain-containing protein [Microbacterium kribbense]|uniref:SRPBCC domain-containing protein n=1 Tax=Microbacterium kribbense TaxID=433645 RepID=A0ABP7H1N1_9MICO